MTESKLNPFDAELLVMIGDIAKSQPEYMPLPAMKIPNDPQGLIITKWQLSPEELERVKETGTIHLSMLTFNQPLQPVLLTVDLPTEK
jgi:hypothetical protein